ncbi:hypothetical protein HYDPIDRAFT_109384 [Hydnomerulius pinastri MD-312]|nr:hypothetical protein HYDPIDRAFT_109384 [Hydnomerulius pinastri MD-312]
MRAKQRLGLLSCAPGLSIPSVLGFVQVQGQNSNGWIYRCADHTTYSVISTDMIYSSVYCR